MRQISKRDTLISFYSLTTTENAMGEPVKSGETLLGKEWAQVFYGRGSERREAAIEGANQPATFIVPSNSTTRAVSIRNVIRIDGQDWDIGNIAPLGRAEIEFTAIRRA